MRGRAQQAILPGLLGAVVVALSIACGPLFAPGLDNFDVTIDACGNYTATVSAHGSGETVEIVVDGKPMHGQVVDGSTVFTETGRVAPGTRSFEARVGEQVVTQVVEVSAPEVQLTVVPVDGAVVPENTPAKFTIEVTASCPLDGYTWQATVTPGEFATPAQPLPSWQRVEFVVPKQPQGRYLLSVLVASEHGKSASTRSTFVVGEATNDVDRDGYPGGIGENDCDDNNPSVHPGMAEASAPNRIDDNCDGRVDEGTTAYDDDGDGRSEDQGDCDDRDAHRYPDAPELADCRDQDCDGTVDEGVELVQVDDGYDPNDEQQRSIDLQTSRRKHFTETLDLVTRAALDEEWFRFYSQDGDWDDWGIDVTVVALGVGNVYDVEVYAGGASPVGAVRADSEHDSAFVRGAAFRDDSGDYWLRVKPVKLARPWCPVKVVVVSR